MSNVENTSTENTAPATVTGVNAEAVANKHINIPHPTVNMQEMDFSFRKDELGNKRPTIKLQIPVPTVEGVINALQDDKQQTYLLGILADEIYKAARWQVGDDQKPVNSQDELDLSKLTLEYLANMPVAERRGGGIGKETWEAFSKDYLEIMPELTNKKLENIQNAVTIFLKRFQPVKTNKKVIAFLREQLALWANATKNLEDFAEVYAFLDNKADTFLKADEAALLENL